MSEKASKYRYRNVWTGGTFDHFHRGHKDLLDKGFEVSEFVTIGITTNELVKDKKYREFIQNLEERKRAVSDYLDRCYGNERYRFVINDSIYTQAVFNPELEANIICFKTKHHGRNINKMRVERGIAPLELVMAPSSATSSSSSEIRKKMFIGEYGYDPFAGKEDSVSAVDRE